MARSHSTATRLCIRCGGPKTRPGQRRFCSDACKINRDAPLPERHPEYGNCWLWEERPGQYVNVWQPERNRTRLAHRAAWEEVTGEDLPDRYAIIGHTCDLRNCVRNDEIGTYMVGGILLPRIGHLFRGTQADNLTDMIEKERWARTHPNGQGEANHSKLTTAQVLDILARYAAGGISQRQLAAEYGVVHTTIGDIVRRTKWQHIK